MLSRHGVNHDEVGRHRRIRVGQRVLKATPVFDTYWKFAAARQDVFYRRAQGASPPWTDDPIIGAHRFTNVYRASDRVSQYMIRNVIYNGSWSAEDLVFRILLFKLFNRIETWELLRSAFDEVAVATFDVEAYDAVLSRAMTRGAHIYSAAYIMPSPRLGGARKHSNHLRLLKQMIQERLFEKIQGAGSLERIYEVLLGVPSLGPFLAFQFAIDINYGPSVDFSEMDFVVAGPGARDGIRKCFADTDGLSDADVIRVVADMADAEFDRLGLSFAGLWGRPLQLIDCQNLFCEVDKYARVAHPTIQGRSGRTRIKQKFARNANPLPQCYPPKWELQIPPSASLCSNSETFDSSPQLAFAMGDL